MGILSVEELYERYVKQLTKEERRQLIALTSENLVADHSPTTKALPSGVETLPEMRRGRKWSDIAGRAEYPLAGEDAQQWVSQTRNESDSGREIPR